MIPVHLSISHPARRLALLVALVVLALCVSLLLVSAVSDLVVAGMAPDDGPLLAPFRWGNGTPGLA